MPETGASLTLAEQVVLLTLGCRHGRITRALRIADLPDLRQVTHALESRGLLISSRRLRRRQASPHAPSVAVRRRLNRIVRSVDTPAGQDAELLLLVAYAGGLDAVSNADHLSARHRIAALGGRRINPPALLAKLCEDLGVDSAAELADKLLPGRVRLRPGDLDPGVTPAVWGGGHGGGTLG